MSKVNKVKKANKGVQPLEKGLNPFNSRTHRNQYMLFSHMVRVEGVSPSKAKSLLTSKSRGVQLEMEKKLKELHHSIYLKNKDKMKDVYAKWSEVQYAKVCNDPELYALELGRCREKAFIKQEKKMLELVSSSKDIKLLLNHLSNYGMVLPVDKGREFRVIKVEQKDCYKKEIGETMKELGVGHSLGAVDLEEVKKELISWGWKETEITKRNEGADLVFDPGLAFSGVAARPYLELRVLEYGKMEALLSRKGHALRKTVYYPKALTNAQVAASINKKALEAFTELDRIEAEKKAAKIQIIKDKKGASSN